MDDGLRVHHDRDTICVKAKKPPRLYHLEALIHQRRGVNSDLVPHVPVRVIKGIRSPCCGYPILGPRAEWSAGRGEYESFDLSPLLTAQALMDGVMLAVDGQDLRTRLRGRSRHELAGHHQGFFVS